MTTYRVTAPSVMPPNFDEVGAVEFTRGQAECDDADHGRELEYFRRRGYLVEPVDQVDETEPEAETELEAETS